MVTLHAYAAYAERPGVWRYTAVLIAFCLAVLSKSMAVTLPLVLLLLDYWPLQRSSQFDSGREVPPKTKKRRNLFRLFIEKVPLLFIATMIGLATFYAIDAASVFTPVPLKSESYAYQKASAYLVYLSKCFYPVGLACPYPVYGRVAPWLTLISAVGILLMSYLVLRWRHRHTYLLVGWFWYLVVLFPVAGFFGPLRIADRYGYLSLIGIYIFISWGAAALYARWPRLKLPCHLAISIWIAVLAVLAFQQAGHWQNTLTLFRNTLVVNPSSSIARSNLGIYWQDQGDLDKAIQYQHEAVQLAPHKPEFHYNLGVALIHQQRYADALLHFSRASGLRPGYVAALSNRGLCLLHMGRLDEARREFERALSLEPNHYHTNNHLGRYYLMTGNFAQAETQFRRLLQHHPGRSSVIANLAATLAAKNNFDEAEHFYREAIRTAPDEAGYYFGLAGVFTRMKRHLDAAELRLEGLARDPQNSAQHYFLSVDYYFAGQYKEARQFLENAKRLTYPGVEILYEQKLEQAFAPDAQQAAGGN